MTELKSAKQETEELFQKYNVSYTQHNLDGTTEKVKRNVNWDDIYNWKTELGDIRTWFQVNEELIERINKIRASNVKQKKKAEKELREEKAKLREFKALVKSARMLLDSPYKYTDDDWSEDSTYYIGDTTDRNLRQAILELNENIEWQEEKVESKEKNVNFWIGQITTSDESLATIARKEDRKQELINRLKMFGQYNA